MRADNTFVLYVLTENVLSEYCPFHPITPNLTPFPETWFQVSCLQQYESPFCPTLPPATRPSVRDTCMIYDMCDFEGVHPFSRLNGACVNYRKIARICIIYFAISTEAELLFTWLLLRVLCVIAGVSVKDDVKKISGGLPFCLFI